ncbi:hypothetical protein RhiirA1_439301 [Rhizophagus irregularis]|uniref:RRM domain-containing protein n=1 Tax=Rhizophagus irregularis TaxID=588596 RepID=A0A2N0S5B5_9GLOM|nr:hypothetical protein RhiirA1_439301 [Rhizophagus irregularis]
MSLNMNHGDNVSENTSIISSSLCNGYENTKNSLDNNKSYSLLKYNQITTAQNELISIQRSLIRELLKDSKEFQEKFGNNYNTKNSNQHEDLECDAMHTNVESIRDEISFVKSFRDLVKGSDGKIDNIKFGNVFSTKNKKNDYTFGQIEQNNGFVYPENSQNHFSPPQNHFSPPQIKENDNIINLPNSPNLYKEVTKGGSSTKVNGASFSNEFPRVRNDFVSSGQNGQHGQNGYYGQNGQHGLNGVHGQNGVYGQNGQHRQNGQHEQNDNLQSTSTSDYQGNYNETNEINEDFFGEYKGFNSIYVGIGKENIDVHQLKQCLENKFGHVRFIRIIRNKNCAFAEFEEKECFSTAIESGYVTLNGLNLKINKTFRKKKEN